MDLRRATPLLCAVLCLPALGDTVITYEQTLQPRIVRVTRNGLAVGTGARLRSIGAGNIRNFFRTRDLDRKAALEAFDQHGIERQVGTMSTLIWGDDEKVFHALQEAFRRVASLGEAVMVITVSNACPWPEKIHSE